MKKTISDGQRRINRFWEGVGCPYADLIKVLDGCPELKRVIEEGEREVTDEERAYVADGCKRLKEAFRAKVKILGEWLGLPSFHLEVKWSLDPKLYQRIGDIDGAWLCEADKSMSDSEKREALVGLLGFKDSSSLEEYRFEIETELIS